MSDLERQLVAKVQGLEPKCTMRQDFHLFLPPLPPPLLPEESTPGKKFEAILMKMPKVQKSLIKVRQRVDALPIRS
jgi:hypothetical protein